MKPKKSDQSNLEKRRVYFFQIGLVVALAFTLLAFEWSQFEPRQGTKLVTLMVDEEPYELPPVTFPPPPLPPPVNPPIDVVDNTKDIPDPEIQSSEVDPDQPIQLQPMEEEEEEIIEEDNGIITMPEKMPEFPGGLEELYRFLSSNTNYPALAKDVGLQGIVYLTFVVEKDGSIKDARILRGIGGGCDEEALRVIHEMPKWTPGKQGGRKVRVQYNMPFRFKLK